MSASDHRSSQRPPRPLSHPAANDTDDAPDLSGLTVVELSEAEIARHSAAPEKEPPADLGLPPLMTGDAIDQHLDARWRAERARDPVREKPDPWPIVEQAFPRIAATIREHWGKRWLDEYFSKLVVDDRGSRQGFPPHVLEAIMEVARFHAAQHAFLKPIGPWEVEVSETKWWHKPGDAPPPKR
jgi:hypothetical protein